MHAASQMRIFYFLYWNIQINTIFIWLTHQFSSSSLPSSFCLFFFLSFMQVISFDMLMCFFFVFGWTQADREKNAHKYENQITQCYTMHVSRPLSCFGCEYFLINSNAEKMGKKGNHFFCAQSTTNKLMISQFFLLFFPFDFYSSIRFSVSLCLSIYHNVCVYSMFVDEFVPMYSWFVANTYLYVDTQDHAYWNSLENIINN